MTRSNLELTQLFVKQRRGVLQNFSVVVLGGLFTVMACLLYTSDAADE